MKPTRITHMILGTTSSQDEYNGNCDYCLILLSAQYVSYLLGWMDHVHRLYQADHSVNGIDCWDFQPRYFSHHERFEHLQDIHNNLPSELPQDGPILLAADPQLAAHYFQAVEGQTVHISKDGLWWSAYIKHTNVRIESAEVKHKTLQRIQRSFGTAQPSQPHQPEAIPAAIQEIHDLLYRDMQDGKEIYNPDKEWDSDIMAAIAEAIAIYIPRPKRRHRHVKKSE